jgi:predicted dehydrogenase
VVLQAVGAPPGTISAVGVAVLSANEDIANARLEFDDGCVANLTASRVSQERLRRIRFFQADAYLSLDLNQKIGEMLWVNAAAEQGKGAVRLPAGFPAFARRSLDVVPGEPLMLQLTAFVRSLNQRGEGAASAWAGREALRVAEAVRAAMKRRAGQWVTR